MKRSLRHKLLCCVMSAALLMQCTAAAMAAEPVDPVEIRYLQGGVPDETGAWVPEYWADSDGNRIEEPTAVRKRAASVLPRSYDLRDFGLVTRVKHQAGTNCCWAFSAIASLESNYIRQGYGTLENTDFSEAHLAWFAQHQRTPDTTDPTYGDGLECADAFKAGGNSDRASSALLRGSGIQLEENAPWITTYDPNALLGMEQPESERYVSYARMLKMTNLRDESATAFKQKIMQNGAATLSYYDDYTLANTGYSADRCSYYQTIQTNKTNHTVTVVGWDDDYPRTNFTGSQMPSSDGAWLIKGSWSTGWANRGYYWISYEEPSLNEFVSYVTAPAEIYDHIYQYDGSYPKSTFSVSNSVWMANVFTAQRDELLTHVAFFSPNATPVKATAEIYVAPDDFVYSGMHPTSGMQKVTAATTVVNDVEYGYTTVELNTPTLLSEGQTYTVVLTMARSGIKVSIPVEGLAVENPGDGVTTCAGSTGQSFFGYGSTSYDTNAYRSGSKTYDYNNVILKAMTRDLPSEYPSLTVLQQPARTTYTVGETLDTTGLSLLYTDAQGNASVVTSGFACDTQSFTTSGTQTVTVTYGGLSASFDCTAIVQEPTLTLVSQPENTAYMVGDTIDPAGLTLLYTDEYGNETTVTDGYAYTPHTLNAIGTTTVMAVYNGLSVTFDVTSAPYETSLSLQYAPRKTVYAVGDTLDTTGLQLLYTDEYNRAHVVTSGFACNPQTFPTLGDQTVNVTYQNLSVSFDVTVMEPGVFTVSDASARAGETVEVAVRVSQNPGIAAAWLELSYDPQVLALEDVQNGEIFPDACFTPGNNLTAVPFRALFVDSLTTDNYTQDGTLVVFTFRVLPDAPGGDTPVSVSYDADSTYDVGLRNIPFVTQDGTLTAQRLPGDVDADGVVNLKDAVLLRRYLAGWDVTVNPDNADVDRIEGVTLKDVTHITRFLAGGYAETLL